MLCQNLISRVPEAPASPSKPRSSRCLPSEALQLLSVPQALKAVIVLHNIFFVDGVPSMSCSTPKTLETRQAEKI